MDRQPPPLRPLIPEANTLLSASSVSGSTAVVAPTEPVASPSSPQANQPVRESQQTVPESKQAGREGSKPAAESTQTTPPAKQSAPVGNKDDKGAASTAPLPLRFGLSGTRPAPPSYSQMLNDIRQGVVREISLSPRQRVATLTYRNGRTAQVAIFNDTQTLLRTAHERFLPYATLLNASDGRDDFVKAMQPVQGKPAAYVCQNQTCQAPVTTAEALLKLLD